MWPMFQVILEKVKGDPCLQHVIPPHYTAFHTDKSALYVYMHTCKCSLFENTTTKPSKKTKEIYSNTIKHKHAGCTLALIGIKYPSMVVKLPPPLGIWETFIEIEHWSVLSVPTAKPSICCVCSACCWWLINECIVCYCTGYCTCQLSKSRWHFIRLW